MTTVDVTYRYSAPMRESTALALASLREVYGIRQMRVDERACSVHIEYDATRLSDQSVRQLLCRTGLELESEKEVVVPDEGASTTPSAAA